MISGKPSEVKDEIAARVDAFPSRVETQRGDKPSFATGIVLLDARRAAEFRRFDGLATMVLF